MNLAKLKKSTFCNNCGELKVMPELQYLGFIFNGRTILCRSQTIAKRKQKAKRAIKSAARSARKSGCKKIYKKKLYSFHSHLENRTGKNKNGNFYSYIRKSSRIMNSKAIKNQVKNHWTWFNTLIDEAEKNL